MKEGKPTKKQLIAALRRRIDELEDEVRSLRGSGHIHAEGFDSSRVLQQCQRCGQLAPPMHTCVFHGSINGAAPSDIVGFSFGHTTQGVAS